MARCKDCVHYEPCLEYGNILDPIHGGLICDDFKDRSKFVELPCKIGDTVYLKLNGIAEILEGDVRKMSFSRKNELIICIGRRQGRYYTTGNFKLSSFGKTVFSAREEDERSLKESENNA